MIDRIEIVKPFRLSDYQLTVVRPLDFSAIPIPLDEKQREARLEAERLIGPICFKKVLIELLPRRAIERPAPAFLAGGSAAGPASDAAPAPSEDASAKNDAVYAGKRPLIVTWRMTKLDPGSRGWTTRALGYGPAETAFEIEGELTDGENGELLVRFRDRAAFNAGLGAGAGLLGTLQFIAENSCPDFGKMINAFGN